MTCRTDGFTGPCGSQAAAVLSGNTTSQDTDTQIGSIKGATALFALFDLKAMIVSQLTDKFIYLVVLLVLVIQWGLAQETGSPQAKPKWYENWHYVIKGGDGSWWWRLLTVIVLMPIVTSVVPSLTKEYQGLVVVFMTLFLVYDTLKEVYTALEHVCDVYCTTSNMKDPHRRAKAQDALEAQGEEGVTSLEKKYREAQCEFAKAVFFDGACWRCHIVLRVGGVCSCVTSLKERVGGVTLCFVLAVSAVV